MVNEKRVTAERARLRFGEWLVEAKRASRDQVVAALQQQKQTGGRVGEALVRLRSLTEDDLVTTLGEFLRVDRVSLQGDSGIDYELARQIPETLAKRFNIVPIDRTNGTLTLAMADPLDFQAKDTIASRFGCSVRPVISSTREIQQAIEKIYHGSDVQEKRLRDLVEVVVSTDFAEGAVVQEDEDLASDISEVAANKAPVVRFVDLMLSQAIQSRASDIHVEPQERKMQIRMRVDGMLREMIPPPRRMQPAVVARLKILAGMDIAERRLPQDGRIRVKAPDRDIDLRVSAIPTIYGEKIVTRILDRHAVNHNLDKLGFEPHLLEILKSNLSQPHGIMIVTGPTGSGKSTTLYSALNYLRDPRLNITTVEDPVEYRLDGINQIQTKPEIGLTFAACLRSILRQDPDIVLIGEIRDRETMEIAIQASLTGHLVLSTFHTNDAPSALSRLAYMGLERYLLASTLNLVVAQRLVRRSCPYCRVSEPLTPEVMRHLGLNPKEHPGATYQRGAGCTSCENTGYAGRLPIFEFLPLDTQLRQMVIEEASEAQLRTAARAKGFGGLLHSGALRVLDGHTTPEEILRVTYIEEPYTEEDSTDAGAQNQ
ncbi:MAG: Flp pilus assembly complex ATPase component TadA [Phycisphaerae bacterium]|nr:Flp pilus assembly complex ATPase component TadA [Phycisphaerae bacterium]